MHCCYSFRPLSLFRSSTASIFQNVTAFSYGRVPVARQRRIRSFSTTCFLPWSSGSDGRLATTARRSVHRRRSPWQRRHYVFLPTSWTELKLRLRQKATPTVVRVNLGYDDHRPRRGAAAAPRRRMPCERPRPLTAASPVIPPAEQHHHHQHRPVHRGLFWRVREMFTGRGRLPKKTTTTSSSLAQPQQRERQERRRRRPQIVRVTVDEHTEREWFDARGRPHVARDATGRFVNPWMSQSTDGVKPLGVLWKWRKQRLRREWREWGWRWFLPTFHHGAPYGRTEEPSQSTPAQRQQQQLFQKPPRPSTMRFTWIGHSTCLIQQDDVIVLTDPIFSERASPFPKTPVGVRRVHPPACAIDGLPARIDVCLISHDHYDHLDRPSVRRLRSRVGLWIVPRGTKEWMITRGRVPADAVVELEWWESVQLTSREDDDDYDNDNRKTFDVTRIHSLREHPTDAHPATRDPPTSSSSDGRRRQLWITCFPTQHWCSRTLWDRNYRLWASYAVLFSHRQVFYFAGDTALPAAFPLFEQIRSYLPWPVSLAALPIGAYEPAILNEDNHANPVEAVRIHETLVRRRRRRRGQKSDGRSVAVHHGSFPLSEEPLEEPAQWLRRAVAEAGLSPEAFVSVRHGAHVDCHAATHRVSTRRKKRPMK